MQLTLYDSCLHPFLFDGVLLTFNCNRKLADEYDAVIICLGAKVDELPEISGKLPLRMCRGVVAELELPNNIKYDLTLTLYASICVVVDLFSSFLWI